MDRSQKTPISDELLSAYIDGVVTNEERARVEAAVAADPVLAWELESLRRTVDLVRDLPPMPLPRNFTLREDQVADVLAERRSRTRQERGSGAAPAPLSDAGLWQQILSFFNSGNLVLRNAAAVAALLLVVITLSAPGQRVTFAPVADSDAGESMQAESSGPVAQRAAPQTEISAAQTAEGMGEAVMEAAAAEAPAAEAPAAKAGPAETVAEAPASEAQASEVAEAPAALAEPAAADAPPRPAGDAPAAMSAASESITEPVARMPAAGAGGENPQAFQAVPADVGVGGDGVVSPARSGPVPAQVEQPEAAPPSAEALPAAKAAPDTFAAAAPDAPQDASQDAPQDMPPDMPSEPVQEQAEMQALEASEEQTGIQTVEAESQEAETQAPALPDSRIGWQIVQLVLTVLVLALGGLWLFSARQSRA